MEKDAHDAADDLITENEGDENLAYEIPEKSDIKTMFKIMFKQGLQVHFGGHE